MKTPLPKISAPAQRALDSVGITCLEELGERNKKEVLALHGMGKKVMTILKKALDEAGLDYAD